MISLLQAWANLGWVPKGYKPQTHSHECTECREIISCTCDDPVALWTTCKLCQELENAA